MKEYKTIAITHKSAKLEKIGEFHVEDDAQEAILQNLKSTLGIDELMYISTCNRVEFIFVSENTTLDDEYLIAFFHAFKPEWSESKLMEAIKSARVFSGSAAIEHLFNVACSLDSLVIGEREIITQLRKSFDRCKNWGLTGDKIRLLIRKTIEVAKQVYTETLISTRPVSIVSLAYKKLKDLDVPLDSRILIIGAGQTNKNMSRFLKKHGFKNFTIFNRTLENGEMLAKELDGKAYALSELKNYNKGFDLIITCTGASEPILTREIYNIILRGDDSTKTIVDLALPSDLDNEVINAFNVRLISIEKLKTIAERNLKEREKEIVKCNTIIQESMKQFEYMYRERCIELKMNAVPKEIKTIKQNAVREIFAKELEGMDETSKEVIDKIVDYMEKKYISIPMKMAKEIMLNEVRNTPGKINSEH